MQPDKKLIQLSFLMLFANFADYFSTVCALQRGFKEANPFLRAAIHANQFTTIKLTVPVLLVIYILTRVYRSDSPKSQQRACGAMLFASLLFTIMAIHNSIKAFLI